MLDGLLTEKVDVEVSSEVPYGKLRVLRVREILRNKKQKTPKKKGFIEVLVKDLLHFYKIMKSVCVEFS